MERRAGKSRRALGGGLVTVAALALTLFTGADVARAHNSLETSNPADGAALDASPASWMLTFTKDVPLDSASAEVIGADGVRVQLAAPVHGASAREIVFAFPAGLSGDISARWRLVGTDGHVVSARVGFSVTAPAGVPATTAALPTDGTTPATAVSSTAGGDSTTPGATRWMLRLLGYSALLVLGGLVTVARFVAPEAASTVQWRWTSLAVAAVAALAPLLQLLVFLDDTGDRGVIGSVPRLADSFDTTAGSMLLLRTVTAAILFVWLARPPGGRDDVLVSAPVLGLLTLHLVTLAYGGHSRSMAWPFLGIPVDVIHTAASMAWLGGLVVVTFLVVSSTDTVTGMAHYARFGRIAQRAVTAIVVTGVIQTLRLHGGIITLFTQSHGRWLLLKIVLVGFMLWVGNINRRRIAREIPADGTVLLARSALLRRAGVTEAVTGGLVMAVTAALVSSSFD